jgi:ubiquinone biosynthesis monooxygenase Coq7
VIEAMRADEAKHRQTAIELGADELPRAVKRGMRIMAKVMTTIAHRV